MRNIKYLSLLPFAFLCSAVSFLVQWREQWLPEPPASQVLTPETPGSWFHKMKNITTETVRADSEWWSKFLSFIILVSWLPNFIQWFLGFWSY